MANKSVESNSIRSSKPTIAKPISMRSRSISQNYTSKSSMRKRANSRVKNFKSKNKSIMPNSLDLLERSSGIPLRAPRPYSPKILEIESPKSHQPKTRISKNSPFSRSRYGNKQRKTQNSFRTCCSGTNGTVGTNGTRESLPADTDQIG